MTRKKWQMWFILSAIWGIINLVIILFFMTPEQLYSMRYNVLYMGNVFISMMNLSICSYIGSLELED